MHRTNKSEPVRPYPRQNSTPQRPCGATDWGPELPWRHKGIQNLCGFSVNVCTVCVYNKPFDPIISNISSHWAHNIDRRKYCTTWQAWHNTKEFLFIPHASGIPRTGLHNFLHFIHVTFPFFRIQDTHRHTDLKRHFELLLTYCLWSSALKKYPQARIWY